MYILLWRLLQKVIFYLYNTKIKNLLDIDQWNYNLLYIRAFHEKCQEIVDKEQSIPGLDTNELNFEIAELKMSEEKLKQSLK